MPGVASDADISRRAGLRVFFSLADLRNPGEKENFVRTGKSRDKCSYSLQILWFHLANVYKSNQQY